MLISSAGFLNSRALQRPACRTDPRVQKVRFIFSVQDLGLLLLDIVGLE
jgi:hypothetical protein